MTVCGFDAGDAGPRDFRESGRSSSTYDGYAILLTNPTDAVPTSGMRVRQQALWCSELNDGIFE